MSPAAIPSQLTVIADLHMSAEPYDDFVHDEALTAFLDHLIAQAPGQERPALLILGDFLDFAKLPLAGSRQLQTSVEAVLPKLELAASRHEAVFAALGRLVDAGVGLDLVVGNHDAELVRPPVRERLGRLLGEAAGAAPAPLRVHPWIYHLPGLLYAEHGHQHHDINRMPELLDPGSIERGGPLAIPLGTHLAEYQLEIEEAKAAGRQLKPQRLLAAVPPAARFAGSVAQAALRMSRAAGRRPPADALRAYSGALGLASDVLGELANMSATGPLDVLKRAMRRAATSPMLATATRIDQILARHGAGTSFYLFGHTHVPDDSPLRSGAAAPRYLNPGTWSTLRPPRTPAHLTFLELNFEAGEASAQLMRWDASQACARPLEGVPDSAGGR